MSIGTPAMTGEMVRGHNQSHSRVDKPDEGRIYAQNVDKEFFLSIVNDIVDKVGEQIDDEADDAQSSLQLPTQEDELTTYRNLLTALNIPWLPNQSAKFLKRKFFNHQKQHIAIMDNAVSTNTRKK